MPGSALLGPLPASRTVPEACKVQRKWQSMGCASHEPQLLLSSELDKAVTCLLGGNHPHPRKAKMEQLYAQGQILAGGI